MKKIFPWLVLAHGLAFILYWLTNALFYQSVNDFLTDALGFRLDYISICLLISTAISLWSVARLVLAWRGKNPGPAWIFYLVGSLYLIFFYASFVILFMQDPGQVGRLGNLLGYFRLLFDVPLLFLLARSLPRLFRRFLARRSIALNWLRILAGLILLALVFLAAVFPPGNVYPGGLDASSVNSTIPPKPLLVAHRGGSMLAPENTLASVEKAASLGVFGLEADVRISRDGVLFLMHDDTLLRTTNVAAVFPGRAKENAASFSFSELRQLSAGEWFVNTDPSGTIAHGQVSPAEADHYRIEPIPSLAEILQVVKDKKLAFAFFDLLAPPKDHPFYDRFFDICLQQIRDVGIDSQIWIQVNGEQLVQVREAAPKMNLTAHIDSAHPPLPTELTSQGYYAVNSEYNLSAGAIQAYRSAGSWVNLYIVDEPWMFSRLWLTGVDSITSNNPQGFIAMQQPFFALPRTTYRILWSILGLLALGVMVFTFNPRKH